jgi:hypothetical protein
MRKYRMERLPRVLSPRRSRRPLLVHWPLQLPATARRKGARMYEQRHERRRDLSSGTDYSVAVADPYTPSNDQAGLLKNNIANPLWGDTPLQYVQWFDSLWHEGDPSRWGPEVFTPDAVMLDAAGLSFGAEAAASDFLLLFKYFPDLRGEVVSWSHNDREIFINWRFVVQKNRECPVIDKFSFTGGLVSYRQAYFDTVMLLGYLAENYGSGPVVDYFVDRFMSAEGGTGVLFLPSLAWTFIKGLFVWSAIPPLPPRGLTATPSEHSVALQWQPVSNAIWYRVSRASSPSGPFTWIKQTTETQYVDLGVVPGTQYFYRVSSHNTVAPIQTPPPPDVTPSTSARLSTR